MGFKPICSHFLSVFFFYWIPPSFCSAFSSHSPPLIVFYGQGFAKEGSRCFRSGWDLFKILWKAPWYLCIFFASPFLSLFCLSSFVDSCHGLACESTWKHGDLWSDWTMPYNLVYILAQPIWCSMWYPWLNLWMWCYLCVCVWYGTKTTALHTWSDRWCDVFICHLNKSVICFPHNSIVPPSNMVFLCSLEQKRCRKEKRENMETGRQWKQNEGSQADQKKDKRITNGKQNQKIMKGKDMKKPMKGKGKKWKGTWKERVAKESDK